MTEDTKFPSVPVARHIELSRWIVRLLAVRPVLNQLRGNMSLASIGSYHVSILSLWSVLFLAIATARLAYGPRPAPAIQRGVVCFLFIVFAFGVPRILFPEAFVNDVLLYCQFFLAALNARGVIDDVGIDYIIDRVTRMTLLLVVMHATAPIWTAVTFIDPDDKNVSAYLGAFEGKHVAGDTFFAVMPFLVCGALRDRSSLATKLLVPILLFLVLTGQRIGMLSVVVMALSLLVLTKRVRLLGPLVALGVLVVALIPTGSLQNFVDRKIDREVEAIREGNLEAVGEGRMEIAMLARNMYFDDSGPFEQAFGRGTAQAWMLHYAVGGILSYAHLQVIEIVIDYGLVGLLALFATLLLITSAKVRAYRSRASPEELVGAAVAITVIAQCFYAMPLESGGTTAMVAFWLFVPAAKLVTQQPAAD